MSDERVAVRSIADEDRAWLRASLASLWGLPVVTVDGVHHHPERLRGLTAHQGDELVGALTWEVGEDGGWQVVTLHSERPRVGAGTALLLELRRLATVAGARRIWLTTTDDNAAALAFYRSVGMQQVAVHADLASRVRRWKPELPETFRDGIELEWVLSERGGLTS